MRKSVTRTVLAAAATIPLSFLVAAPAGAAPQPVTLDATGGATQIELQFALVSNGYEGTFCVYEVYPQGDGTPLTADGTLPITFDTPPAPIIVGPTDPGIYEVYWACYADDGVTFGQIAGSPEETPELVTVGAPVGPSTGSAGSSNLEPAGLGRILAGLFNG